MHRRHRRRRRRRSDSTTSENDPPLFDFGRLRDILFGDDWDSQATTIRFEDDFDVQFADTATAAADATQAPLISNPDGFHDCATVGFGNREGLEAVSHPTPAHDPWNFNPDGFHDCATVGVEIPGGSGLDLGETPPASKRARHGGDECYQVWVKTLTGKTVILWVEAADSIATVKLALAVFMGWLAVRPCDLRLVYCGMQLEDHKTLGDHRVTEGSTLHVSLRVRGGAGGGMDDSDGDAMHDLSQDQQQQPQVAKCPLGGRPSTPQVGPQAQFLIQFCEF